MNKAIGKTGPVVALGAMSGTSLDGVDAAVLSTDGHDILSFGSSAYRAYTPQDRATIAAGFGKWSGAEVEAAAQVVEAAHLELLSGFEDVELIGFHGQTLAHAPRLQGTLQVGNGAALADALGVPVVWDFRSADVELGGEGAPLAPFFHHACARWAKLTEPVAFLNLGGVGNLTWVDPSFDKPQEDGALLAFDTGPANAPVNDLMQSRLDLPFDKGGKVAAKGQVEQGALELFLAEPYFARMPPKSLDRNDFAEMVALVNELSDADAAATLTAMCAAGVAEAMQHCPKPPTRVLVTGGGRHNPVLMQMLAVSLDCPVTPVEDIGLDGDMLEAQAFAYLAVRVARGLPTSCPGTTGVRAAVGGGTVSLP
ncbi:anhydro-N-acetylmuramic acid kinase [Sulfitobacter mediterraneus]|uniref:anhydro-N-acetylmuramic acid kinase n=1 Tax=Sulfitobacter mediterraneus TaxID=83219 RepID=UPI00193A40A6|nr:anhydro-N-acetylmuramic acid kinase [Sulfitobacter mediterraneus]MBM1557155.1 anhydro-N-acetylmuramic acid kinase [Sulfitobacter mediterraneus]MBM1568201.1 anhydro-N-acetylmuramic acid kinase [Sulfitobacter mediterraneus]MBM1572196.1 anhydro-N-acetylmuramic acid kinase [Sulfitobacter mediterraneus]MBM1575985.1 anhydro-N-acetylmuramic acid kinase [Sulfitobacter mediterraneus]MBM1580307.1 anhydro-N-acetylmuramic acid kinase [Sulfitobacter mediterraneus]